MGLDVYWQEAQARKYLGSLEIDTPLENLLYEFGQTTGIPVDPYGKARLYLTQWKKLIEMAQQRYYPTQALKEIQAGVSTPEAEGLLILIGD
jgi:hypothetical protein